MPEIKENVSLAPLTTFGIGGLARYFAKAGSLEEFKKIAEFAGDKKIPIFVLGGGSNILVSDKGFWGLVIKNEMKGFSFDGVSGEAASGENFTAFANASVTSGLKGLEWAIGIPGTVGGAVAGNAGAFGKDTSGVFAAADIFDLESFSVKKMTKKECEFSYRNSLFKKKNNLIVLKAYFVFEKADAAALRADISAYAKQRGGSYTPGWKCAGCFYKNIGWDDLVLEKKEIIKNFPELAKYADKPKIPAGFLIEDVGLKGFKMGGAMVSDKHANFILNSGKATAEEIIMLSALVKSRVRKKYGFTLEEEVQLVGFDN
jgi:UDP-N-acetylmuramate dehydrogenase